VGALLVEGTLAAPVAEATPTPWRARQRGRMRASERAAVLVSPDDFPAEPPSPDAASIDLDRFAQALRAICGFMPRERPRQYAEWIVGYAREAGVDPFLLGALVFRMGRCDADAAEMHGLGLTLVPRAMFGADRRRGVYRYRVRKRGAWATREVRLDRFPFTAAQLLRPEPNLYFAAHLLAALQAQHEDLDAAFPQAPHRHFVSHWVWGDAVRSARAEDRVLGDRRRLLERYGARPPMATIRVRGVEVGSPLDGGPRVLSSFLGSDRDEGARSHRGVDVEAAAGEVVRAIADGRVTFAGCDMPGERAAVPLPPGRVGEVPRSQLGPGGRFVCVLHRPREEGASGGGARGGGAAAGDGAEGGGAGALVSCSMHLEETRVSVGDRVVRGQELGTVGRTGMRVSSPHLHLELRVPGGVLDPAQEMAGLFLGREPPDERAARARARRRRGRQAWLARREERGVTRR
jgi:murein DD-endopeptidase MepM/ murein hydrolase activator NlpD